MFDHIDFAVRDLERSRAFYATVLATLGIAPVIDIRREDGCTGTGFGVGGDARFWIGGGLPVRGRLHIAFEAETRSAVEAFHAAAIAAGGLDHGPPGLRPRYGEPYFAAFVLDPDGHVIEVVCRRREAGDQMPSAEAATHTDPLLAAGDIRLRPFTADDVLPLYRAVRESMDSLSAWLPWCHPDYSQADAAAWVAHCAQAWREQSGYPLGIFNDRGELLGGAGLSQLNRPCNLANIGYWVGVPHRDRGVATTVAPLVAQLGFRLGFTRLEIVTHRDNRASQRVAERIGATREGEVRNRVLFRGQPAPAILYSLIPDDIP